MLLNLAASHAVLCLEQERQLKHLITTCTVASVCISLRILEVLEALPAFAPRMYWT